MNESAGPALGPLAQPASTFLLVASGDCDWVPKKARRKLPKGPPSNVRPPCNSTLACCTVRVHPPMILSVGLIAITLHQHHGRWQRMGKTNRDCRENSVMSMGPCHAGP
ncbi:unnamed protein product [Periconia digitata]|uniref:Uncharacterized protein n=1 Tax=Periconia digitata TaxID=1303443 RepID=A0A9W4URC8_9PLEO|nr:unnamed protein product [Periconia digitata]